MKVWHSTLILILIAGVLVGCGGDAAPSVEGAPSGDGGASMEEQGSSVQALEESAARESYTSAVLDVSYEEALPASSQLVLGIFRLEGMENVVTPEQAQTLLPLWQAIQGGTLQSDAETNAVLKQIEGALTAEQLAAIAALQLTFEDMGTWMQEQGVNFGGPQGVGGGQGPSGDLSEEEQAAMRATRQAGGGFGGEGGPFGNMSEEERESMRATAEAGGMTRPGGGAPGGGLVGQLAMLAEQVIELLTERAAE
jgi:hypothetical protein